MCTCSWMKNCGGRACKLDLRNEKTRMSLALWNPSRRWSECLWPSKILGEPTKNHRDFPTWLRCAIENMCKQMLPQKSCRTCFIASGPWTGGLRFSIIQLGSCFLCPRKRTTQQNNRGKVSGCSLGRRAQGSASDQTLPTKIKISIHTWVKFRVLDWI